MPPSIDSNDHAGAMGLSQTRHKSSWINWAPERRILGLNLVKIVVSGGFEAMSVQT
jgi:hypothetical protein